MGKIQDGVGFFHDRGTNFFYSNNPTAHPKTTEN